MGIQPCGAFFWLIFKYASVMIFSLSITEAWPDSQAPTTAYLFAKSALARGHKIFRVFFSGNGVLNASNLHCHQEEDFNIFAALIAAVDNRGDQIVTNVGSLSPASLNTAFRFIEQHDLVATKIVVHANQYAAIRVFGKDFYDEATTREILTSGLFGHLWTADIHVSSKMDPDSVLVVASPDTVGAFPIRQDITVLPADDPKKLRLGWVIYEEIGIVIVNDYAISLIEVTSGT